MTALGEAQKELARAWELSSAVDIDNESAVHWGV